AMARMGVGLAETLARAGAPRSPTPAAAIADRARNRRRERGRENLLTVDGVSAEEWQSSSRESVDWQASRTGPQEAEDTSACCWSGERESCGAGAAEWTSG